jgi:glycerol-3-phosphate acyltransferase PlsX
LENTKPIISVDAMGGDLGPTEVVLGIAKSSAINPEARFIIHGDLPTLSKLVEGKSIHDKCRIVDAKDIVSMDQKPSYIIRHGKNTSMWSAIQSVRMGEANVCVSCGNTGALMALSMLRLRKSPGVNRPAIACLWPSRNALGFNIVLDVGADIKADEQDLLQFALMGLNYARRGLKISRPRIGLLNVGTEEHKGRTELKLAHDLILNASKKENFEFVGFIEGGDIPSNMIDIIVTDGFTGNIAIKTAEGTSRLISEKLKFAFNSNLFSRIGALFSAPSLLKMRKQIDPSRVNGGVFLGLNGIVIKSHGSADTIGIASALNLGITLNNAGLYDRSLNEVSVKQEEVKTK